MCGLCGFADVGGARVVVKVDGGREESMECEQLWYSSKIKCFISCLGLISML